MTTESASTQAELTGKVNDYELQLEDVTRSTVTILGDAYELSEPDDFPYAELKHINRMWKRVNAIDEMEEPSDDQCKEYEDTLDKMVMMVCPSLPKEILEHPRFGRTDKSQIIIAFFLEAANKMPLKIKLPTITPSAESSDSMEDPLKATPEHASAI